LPADLALYDDLPGKYDRKVRLTSNETGGSVTRPMGEVLRERYAEITAMDRAIGTLRRHLREKGLRENTLVFYCGDNGTSSDAALGLPHRGVKGQLYEGGTLVPGVLEWPARISKGRSTAFRAYTSDLLPTLCALSGQPVPKRPLDGVDLTPVLDGKFSQRSSPLFFWEFNGGRYAGTNPQPYIDPKLQEGTTPLVKRAGGKATRDFTNYRHPDIIPADFLGTRSIITGDEKLLIHDQKGGGTRVELYNLATDPAEKQNLAPEKPATVEKLQTTLRIWQESVVKSLTGADYRE
jgi:arylsulfatase A-like enzyme